MKNPATKLKYFFVHAGDQLKQLVADTGNHFHQAVQLLTSLPSETLASTLHAFHPYFFGLEVILASVLVYLLMHGQGNLLQTALSCAALCAGISRGH
jgi:hypothetical protein